MPRYDFRCPAGHTTEARQGMDITSMPCPICGEQAQRQPIYVVFLRGETVPKYQVSSYQEAAAEANYYHERMENDRGRKLPRRPTLNIAAEKARQRGAKVKALPKGI